MHYKINNHEVKTSWNITNNIKQTVIGRQKIHIMSIVNNVTENDESEFEYEDSDEYYDSEYEDEESVADDGLENHELGDAEVANPNANFQEQPVDVIDSETNTNDEWLQLPDSGDLEGLAYGESAEVGKDTVADYEQLVYVEDSEDMVNGEQDELP